MKRPRILVGTLCLLVVTTGLLTWHFGFIPNKPQNTSMAPTNHDMNQSAGKGIHIAGSLYVVNPKIPTETGANEITRSLVPVSVAVAKPQAEADKTKNELPNETHNDATAESEKEIVIESTKDIYTAFPFLKESNGTPQAAVLHAKILLALQWREFTLIATKPTATDIAEFESALATSRQNTLKRFYEGPDGPVAESKGNIDMSRLEYPVDFLQVREPLQGSTTVSFFAISPDGIPVFFRQNFVTDTLNYDPEWWRGTSLLPY